MSRILARCLSLVLLSGLAACGVLRAEDETQKPSSEEKPLVQIAILLDNSGSMSGLINQARSELWKIVNEFVDAELHAARPALQVAVYHYGNPPAVQLVTLTDNLDRVSEALFSIPVSGGSEYCGQVIEMATRDLPWSDSPRDLKLIFIAGNEPFTQGPIDYREACKAAITKGIMVNTIHCGPGIPDGWRDGALLADGKAMNIDHTQAVVHIEAPQDREIAQLGVQLNETYLAYGRAGQAGLERQTSQDKNASQLSIASAQQRAVAKANFFYRNSDWDLCDACKEGKIDLAAIPVDSLPKEMRTMTPQQRKAYVAEKQKQRESIQQKINRLNQKRTQFVAQKRKELSEKNRDATLDEALVGAIRVQAGEKGFTFGKQDFGK